MTDAADKHRRVLFLAYFFPPLGGGGVQRTVKFVKYLAQHGWSPEVVTVQQGDYWVEDATLAADVPPGTPVHRTGALTGLTLLGWLSGARRGRRPAADGAAQPSSGGAPRATPGEPSAADDVRSSAVAARPDQVTPSTSGGRRSTRLFALLRWLSSFFLVPDAYVGWYPFAVRAVERRLAAGDIDVLVTTSSPDTAHLVGLRAHRRTGIPWVADFRDPWVRRLTFQPATPLHALLHARLERRVLENADRVVVTNAATRDDFRERHPHIPLERFAVVPNGYDPDDMRGAEADDQAPPFERTQGAMCLLHSGLLSGRRTLAPVVDALARLRASGHSLERRLELVQLGPREAINERLVREAGVATIVRFLPPVDHRAVLRAMGHADALLLIEHGDARGALITPGKIFEYLATGKPILAVVPEGPAADLVREMDAGAVVAPEDAEGLARVLAEWVEHGAPPAGADRARLARYERANLTAELARVLDALVDVERRSTA